MEKSSMRRKIRIIYHDPDATDCSSDEEPSLVPGKKIVREINLTLPILPGKQENEKNTISKQTKKSLSSVYKGVRWRPWGTFGAEITHPITKNKLWLGTFASEQEAAAAYRKKAEEFKKLKRPPKIVKLEKLDDLCLVCSPESPSSVLDVTTPSQTGRSKTEYVEDEEEGSVLDLWLVPTLQPDVAQELLQFGYGIWDGGMETETGFPIEENKALREWNVVKVVEGEGFEEEEGEGVLFPDICVEELVSPSMREQCSDFGFEFGEVFADSSCMVDDDDDSVVGFSGIETFIDQILSFD